MAGFASESVAGFIGIRSMATGGAQVVHWIAQQWPDLVGRLLAVLWKATEKRDVTAELTRQVHWWCIRETPFAIRE